MSDEAATTTTSAEEISPQRAWQILCEEPRAQLVDVRTEPEWTYVGMPDLGAAGKAVLRVSWHVFPSMTDNEEFLAQLIEAALATDQTLLFLCRSGGRSLAAASAAMAAGFSRTYSIRGGFEGPPDDQGHRGRMAGWKSAGLPWRQT
jgi:rhodanese-related sulfurtransferase